MKFVFIADIISIALLLIFGIWAIVFLKRNSEKPIEEVRKPLIKGINIIIVLTVLSAILTVVMIVLKK